MNTENWTLNIIESTNGMEKVLPNKILFDKIQNRIKLETLVSKLILF